MGESRREATRIAMSNSGGGEIVEVQGGHIVRSTGRKDRHSKVCTAKGPRDRRVRLSANTAIQFYDVQDRLGYDRPSKAVDWLIKKAKASIDELAELPAWEPTASTPTSATKTRATTQKNQHEREHEFVNKSKRRMSDSSTMELYSGDIHGMQHEVGGENTNQSNSGLSFLPVSLESDPIADTFKSFFPMGASTGAEATSTINHFENYSPDLLPRASSQSQDLRLSLQSFQEPILLHQQPHHNEQQVLLPGAAMVAHQLSFDGFGWPDQYHHNHHNTQDINRFQRLMSWNAGGGIDSGSSASGSGGYTFNLPPRPQPTPVSGQQPVLQPLFGQNQFFTQRGPLQSSNTPSIRAYADPVIAIDNHYHIQQSQHHQTVLSSVGLTSAVSGSSGRFSELRIPARIQGDEEHDGIANKPSSASSDYRR